MLILMVTPCNFNEDVIEAQYLLVFDQVCW